MIQTPSGKLKKNTLQWCIFTSSCHECRTSISPPREKPQRQRRTPQVIHAYAVTGISLTLVGLAPILNALFNPICGLLTRFDNDCSVIPISADVTLGIMMIMAGVTFIVLSMRIKSNTPMQVKSDISILALLSSSPK